ncbi:hypothetical protein P3G55_20720 [Leptospira sp. 96542]|nr:hypothetical protein [Leptospira sp. 96542]
MQIHVQAVSPFEAAPEFSQCIDPDGRDTPDEMARAGKCFKVSASGCAVFMSIGSQAGQMWCFAAAARQGSRGMADVALHFLEHAARVTGHATAGFQTARMGLVRRAQRRGWEIVKHIGRDWKTVGWVLEKKV